MDLLEVLDQVRELLHSKRRITYRMLKAQFQLDDEALWADLVEALAVKHRELDVVRQIRVLFDADVEYQSQVTTICTHARHGLELRDSRLHKGRRSAYDGQIEAAFGERDTDSLADPAAATGDNRDLVQIGTIFLSASMGPG